MTLSAKQKLKLFIDFVSMSIQQGTLPVDQATSLVLQQAVSSILQDRRQRDNEDVQLERHAQRNMLRLRALAEAAEAEVSVPRSADGREPGMSSSNHSDNKLLGIAIVVPVA